MGFFWNRDRGRGGRSGDSDRGNFGEIKRGDWRPSSESDPHRSGGESEGLH